MASAPVISAAAMRRGMLRYDSRAGAGPMHTSSSAKRTCSDSRSASEYTATVCTPSSRHARMTRSAISPRFAIRTSLNMTSCQSGRSEEFIGAGFAAGRKSGHPVPRSPSSLGLTTFGFASAVRILLEPRPRAVAGAGHALHAQRELRGTRRIEHGALIGDRAARVMLHERLVEALH